MFKGGGVERPVLIHLHSAVDKSTPDYDFLNEGEIAVRHNNDTDAAIFTKTEDGNIANFITEKKIDEKVKVVSDDLTAHKKTYAEKINSIDETLQELIQSNPDVGGYAKEDWVSNNFLGLGGGTIKGNLNIGYNKLYIGDGSDNFYIGWDGSNMFAYNNYYGHYFATNGAEQMRITQSGNVLIGTTTDNGAKLQIGANVPNLISIKRTSADGGAYIDYIGGNAANKQWRVGADSGGNFIFENNNSDTVFESVVINSSGSVGIGTSNPAYKLDVNGPIAGHEIYSFAGWMTLSGAENTSYSTYLDNKNQYGLKIHFSNGVPGAFFRQDGDTEFYGNINASGAISANRGVFSSGTWCDQLSLQGTNTNAGLKFFTNDTLEGLLYASGKVIRWYNGDGDDSAIITTANIGSQSVNYANSAGYASSAGGVDWGNVSNRPSSLPANGGASEYSHYTYYTARAGKGFNGVQFIQSNGLSEFPSSDWYSSMVMHHANSSGYYTEIAAHFHGDNLYFRRQAAGTTYDWKRIALSGEAQPASDVYGWAKAASKPSYSYSEVGAAPATHSHDYLPLTGGTVNGSITASAFYQSSDRELKTNIKPVENALDYVLDTNYVTFDWKSNGEKSVGIIAQEEKDREFGFLVGHNGKNYTYEYAPHVAILGAALKEEHEKVKSLEERIKKLEEIIEKLTQQ